MRLDVIKLLHKLYSWLNGRLERISKWGERSSLNAQTKAHDFDHFIRIGWRVILFAFGGFMIWASFAPLDKGVPASGFVITDGQRKIIQPATSGIIDEILVEEGEHVEEGQVLALMNSTMAFSRLKTSQENVTALGEQIESLMHGISSKKNQLAIMQRQLNNARDLAREGYLPKNRVLELEQNYAQLDSAIAMDQSTLQERKRVLSEEQSKIAPEELDLARTEIKSPVTGYVVNLQFFTRGGIVQAGQKLMEVTPDNQPLVVEAKLPINLVDKVHEGDRVEILFSALNQNKTPRIPGVLKVVGDDRIVEDRPQDPKMLSYYRILVEITPEGEKKLGDNKIRAGMPADVFIKTGERTLLSYMIKPMIDRMHSALREE